MPSDDIQHMLKHDMDQLIDARRDDQFARQLATKFAVKRRRRTGAIMFAGGLGAAFAATQFASTVKAISPVIQATALEHSASTPTTGLTPELLATLMIAGAFLLTVMIIRQDV